MHVVAPYTVFYDGRGGRNGRIDNELQTECPEIPSQPLGDRGSRPPCG